MTYKLQNGYEARVHCHADSHHNTVITNNEKPLVELLKDHGVVMNDTEFNWVVEHAGAENDDWIVQIRRHDDPREDV